MYTQYRHFRKDTNPELFNNFLQAMERMKKGTVPNGCIAVTQCIMRLDKDKDSPALVGTAFCGRKDQFTKRLGREIAQGRALKRLEAAELLVQTHIQLHTQADFEGQWVQGEDGTDGIILDRLCVDWHVFIPKGAFDVGQAD